MLNNSLYFVCFLFLLVALTIAHPHTFYKASTWKGHNYHNSSNSNSSRFNHPWGHHYHDWHRNYTEERFCHYPNRNSTKNTTTITHHTSTYFTTHIPQFIAPHTQAPHTTHAKTTTSQSCTLIMSIPLPSGQCTTKTCSPSALGLSGVASASCSGNNCVLAATADGTCNGCNTVCTSVKSKFLGSTCSCSSSGETPKGDYHTIEKSEKKKPITTSQTCTLKLSLPLPPGQCTTTTCTTSLLGPGSGGSAVCSGNNCLLSAPANQSCDGCDYICSTIKSNAPGSTCYCVSGETRKGEHHTTNTSHSSHTSHTCHVIPDLTVGRITVTNPHLFPLIVLGIFIGFLFCALSSQAVKLVNGAPISYGLVFFFFASMNICQLLFYCMFPSTRSARALIISLFGDGLSASSIGFSLFMCALVDAGLVRDSSPYKMGLSLIGYLFLLYAWVQTYFFFFFYNYGIVFLYFGIPIAGFTTYYITQAFWLFRSNSRRAAPYLVLSILSTLLAFGGIFLHVHNCRFLPAYASGEMFWFLGLNFSFFFLFKYYISRVDNPPAYSPVSSESVEDGKVVDAAESTIEALYPQSTMQTKQ